MIYRLILIALLIPSLAFGQLGQTRTPFSGSGGVANVAEPPITSGDASTVTASPDFVLPATLSASGSCVVAGNTASAAIKMEGLTGAGVQYSRAGGSFTAKVQFSTDNGTTWADTFFISGLGTLSSTVTRACCGSTSGMYSIAVPGGSTHICFVQTAVSGGSTTVTLTGTTVGSGINLSVTPSLTTSLGGFTLPYTTNSPMTLGGTPFTLSAVSSSFTPPAVTDIQPPAVVMTFSGGGINANINYMTVPQNNYVIDNVIVHVVGPAAVASGIYARLVKREIAKNGFTGAAPAAPAAPTGAVIANIQGLGGTFQYKCVAVEQWGYEGNISPASLNVVPTAGQGVTVTCGAVSAGAAGWNVYRTDSGPGPTFFYLGRTNQTTYNDSGTSTTGGFAAGTIPAWGTVVPVDTPSAPFGELIFEVLKALASAPTRLLTCATNPNKVGDNCRNLVIAPAATLGTRYRIPFEQGNRAFVATPTAISQLTRDVNSNYGVNGRSQILSQWASDGYTTGFDKTDATIGGVYVLWREYLYGITDQQAAGGSPTSGSVLKMNWVAPPVFGINDEIAIEVGNAAVTTPAAMSIHIYVTGRYF